MIQTVNNLEQRQHMPKLILLKGHKNLLLRSIHNNLNVNDETSDTKVEESNA